MRDGPLQILEAAQVLPDVTEQPAFLKNGFGIVEDPHRRHRGKGRRHVLDAPIAPGAEGRGPRLKKLNARPLAHDGQLLAGLVPPAGEGETDDADAIIRTRETRPRVDAG